MESVLKRCISGLPKTECPYIPKSYLQQYRSRTPRSIPDNAPNHMLAKRSFQFPDDLALSQTVANEPVVQCEERRLLGTQILIEKGQNVDSMLSRFVGNFIMMFSNQTSSQEVSKFQENQIYIGGSRIAFRWEIKGLYILYVLFIVIIVHHRKFSIFL